MKSVTRVVAAAAVGAFLVVALVGCVTLWIPGAGPGLAKAGGKGGGPKDAPRATRELSLPPLSNNSTIRLEAGDYVGDLTIRANKVTIVGRGAGATRIRGRVTILGNNCTMTQLSILGPVLINGSNADLRGARVEGKVTSSGKNNAW